MCAVNRQVESSTGLIQKNTHFFCVQGAFLCVVLLGPPDAPWGGGQSVKGRADASGLLGGACVSCWEVAEPFSGRGAHGAC